MKWKPCLRRLAVTCCVLALLVTSAAALSVEDARTLLEETYVDELPEAAYTAATLEELFAAIGDPYTYYMTAEEYTDFLSSVEHEDAVTGIGAAISYTDEAAEPRRWGFRPVISSPPSRASPAPLPGRRTAPCWWASRAPM